MRQIFERLHQRPEYLPAPQRVGYGMTAETDSGKAKGRVMIVEKMPASRIEGIRSRVARCFRSSTTLQANVIGMHRAIRLPVPPPLEIDS